MKKPLNLMPILCLLFFFSSFLCNYEVSASDDKKELKDAASKYWNFRLTGDVVACYQLEEPVFQRKVPLSQYARAGNIIYKDVKVDNISIQKDIGTVEVKISYIIPALGSKAIFHQIVIDKWKKIDGHWYHVMRQGNPLMNKNGTTN